MRILATAVCALFLGCPSSDDGGPDGTALQFTALSETYDTALFSVWAAGEDVWIAGGERGKSTVLHLKDNAWIAHDTGLMQPLWWVHGFKDGPVWVVGDEGASARYDGGTWTTHDTGATGSVLYGVWGPTPNLLWAVGGPSDAVDTANAAGDMLLKWDGSAWSRVNLPALADSENVGSNRLFKVWGTAANHAIIVGDDGIALHYDGSDWSRKDTGHAGEFIFTVSGRSSSEAFAIGGFNQIFVIRWNGSEWADIPITSTLATPPVAQGVWTAPGEDLYIAGFGGFAARWDATGTWHEGEYATTDVYHAITRDSTGAVWAVGGDIATARADHRGVISVAGREVPPLP